MNIKVDSLLHSFAQNLDAVDKLMRAKVTGDQDADGWGKYLSDEPLYQQLEGRYISGSLTRENLYEISGILLREFDFLRNDVVNHISGMTLMDGPKPQRPVKLTSLIEDVADLFQFKAAERGIEIRADARDELIILGDATLLRRLFVNLMDNAIKYSYSKPPGGPPRHVDFRARRHTAQGDILIEMISFGVGILPDEIASGALFEYGHRGTLAADRHRRGTGIGLAEAKRIVDFHGGRIMLNSTPQDGGAFLTNVSVWLPAGT